MPQRTCAACRNKGDANDFFRMVVGPGGKIVCELGSKLPGEGLIAVLTWAAFQG